MSVLSALSGPSNQIEGVSVGAHRGRLMAGRSVSGKPVFWLDGIDSNVSIGVARTRIESAGHPARSTPPTSSRTPVAPGSLRRSTTRSNPGVTLSQPGKAHDLKRHLATTVLPRRVTHTIFGVAPGSDDWWSSQANREASAQIMRLAERLHVADVDRWATGVLSTVNRGGTPDGTQMLRAAQMSALGTQLGSPTQPAALSVSEIRQLASARALTQPTATAQENRTTTGQRPTPPSVSPRLINTRSEWTQTLPVRGTSSPAVNVSVSTKQNLQRQLRALGIECDNPTTIRTGPGSHAVVGVTKGGTLFQVAIGSDGSISPRSAALAGGHTIRTDPPGEATDGSSQQTGKPEAKETLLLTGPKVPYQSVISIPPPSPESIPMIAQPTKVIGAGGVNVIYEHPTNPDLVVSMTNERLIAQVARIENGDAGPWELRSTSGDVNTLKWLGQAGLPVIKPIELVRIGNRYGVVKPKITGGVFSKDPAPVSTAAWRDLIKSHGREIIQQLRHIDRSMAKLGVVDFDFQFYIDARGQVALYDPGLVTQERDPSRHQHRITELWVDRIRTDMLRIRYGEPVTGEDQKNMPRL